MRILIVATNREKAPVPVAPIGACNIATVLDDAGHDVHFLDLMWERKPLKALEKAVQRIQPEAVGLSVRNLDNTSWMNNVWYLDDARDYVRMARSASGGVPVLVGGPSVAVAPGPVVAYLEADHGIWGDGERSVVELVATLESGGDAAGVKGVVTPNAGGPGLHRVNEQYRVEEMGAIPNHRMWTWLDFRNYVKNSGPLQIQSRRGCAFKCTYCNYPSIEGASYRQKPPEQVAEEIAMMAREYPGAAIEFVDNTFNVPLKYCLSLLDAIIEKDIGAPLGTNGFNPRATSIELMEKMERAGFTQVLITPEVATDSMLESLQKGFTMAHLRKAVEHRRWLLEQGSKMEWMWVFLLGGPGETKDTMRETFRFIQDEIPKDDMIFVQVGLRVYPNTPLQQQAIELGAIQADDDLLESYHFVSPELEPMWIYDELMKNINERPNITTLKDVMSPMFPYYLRLSGALGFKAPVTSAQPGLKWLSKFGLRSVGPDKSARK